MKCFTCGEEMTDLGIDLTDDEVRDMMFLSNKYQVSQQAMRLDSINAKDFKEGQIFEYFLAAYHNMAEVEFLKYVWIKNVREKYKIAEDVAFDFVNGRLYTHVH